MHEKDKKAVALGFDLTSLLSGLSEDQIAAVRVAIQGKFPISTDDYLPDAIASGVSRWAGQYRYEARKSLKEFLLKGVRQGASLRQLTDAANKIAEVRAGGSTEELVKTIVFGAYNRANLECWKRANGVKTVVWWSAEDAEVCDRCASMHGKEIAISDADPSPLHLGCRCDVRPSKISLE